MQVRRRRQSRKIVKKSVVLAALIFQYKIMIFFEISLVFGLLFVFCRVIIRQKREIVGFGPEFAMWLAHRVLQGKIF